MTEKDLKKLIKKIGIPSAYDHFAEGESPGLPFITYRYTSSDNFSADDTVYFPISNIEIELYTEKKDPVSEKKVSKNLSDAGIFYEKYESYISSEKMYQIIFAFSEGTN
ncbi:hypothetical protein [Butyrivibrio sp. FC2001]|uniref:hypothetical protein n=1 Tax=Butyrivibrio sp. FC2001 TaxID=1280671 RepID=UPI000407F848|nr:hypothetical protein [Butyrivibrio sp. FC2001]